MGLSMKGGAGGLIAGLLGLVVAVMVIAKIFKPLVQSVSTSTPVFKDVDGVASSKAIPDTVVDLFCSAGTIPMKVTGNGWSSTYDFFTFGGSYCTNQADGTVGSLLLIVPIVLVAIVLVAIVGYMKTR